MVLKTCATFLQTAVILHIADNISSDASHNKALYKKTDYLLTYLILSIVRNIKMLTQKHH